MAVFCFAALFEEQSFEAAILAGQKMSETSRESVPAGASPHGEKNLTGEQ
jgi:hypothetical protein